MSGQLFRVFRVSFLNGLNKGQPRVVGRIEGVVVKPMISSRLSTPGSP